ncbi:hypothetical protein D3C87_996130 [compost metagenome]
MKAICAFLVVISPILSWAQTQTKSQCVATLRARSMSLSSADAEKICSEDSSDIGNCAITKMQGSHRGGMAAAVKACRSESSWSQPTPSPTPTVTPTPIASPTSIKVPILDPTEEDEKAPKKSNEKKSEQKGTFEEL